MPTRAFKDFAIHEGSIVTLEKEAVFEWELDEDNLNNVPREKFFEAIKPTAEGYLSLIVQFRYMECKNLEQFSHALAITNLSTS